MNEEFVEIESVVKLKYHKPLAELNWVLTKALETSTASKAGDKVENWFKSHNDIPVHEIPKDMMAMVNLFDIRKYGQTKLRFQR